MPRDSRGLRLGVGVLVALLGCEWGTDRAPLVLPPSWGADVVVKIDGGGRVVSDLEGIRCPEECAVRVVPDQAVKGSPKQIGLRAIADPGWRFVEWKFDRQRVPTRGPGNDECNPIRRSGESPDVSGDAIALGFGEVDGLPPPGLSEKCAKYTRVPLVYDVTASFEPSGPGQSDVYVTIPSSIGEPREIMVAQDRIFVRVVSADTDVPSWQIAIIEPTALDIVRVVSPRITGQVPVDMTHHVVWQETNGRIGTVGRDSGKLVQWSPSPRVQCTAMTSDATSIYCRSFDEQIVRWNTDGSGQTVLRAGVGGGDALVANGTTLFYTVNDASSALLRMPSALVPDAGPPPVSTVATGLNAPARLRADDRFVWASIGFSNQDLVRVAQLDGAVETYAIGAPAIVFAIEPTLADPGRAFVGSTGSDGLWQIRSFGDDGIRPFRVGIERLDSLAFERPWLYWTTGDGRIYRGKP